MAKWVYERATGKWMVGFRDSTAVHRLPDAYDVVEVADEAVPDPVLQRYDAESQAPRAATPQELAESRVDAERAAFDDAWRRSRFVVALGLVLGEASGVTTEDDLRARVWARYRARSEG